MFAHKEFPFITCNPDGILAFPDGRFALFEAKTATVWKRDDWWNGIPDYYEPQPRQYLEVLNDPRFIGGYIGCCFGGLPSDMKIHSYERDTAAGALQLRKVAEYWNAYIVPGVLPPFSGDMELDAEAAYKYITVTTQKGTDDTLPDSCVPLFEEYFELQSRLKAINRDIKDVETEETALLAQIKPCAADGLTLCSLPDDLTYKIKVSDMTRETVIDTNIPGNVKTWILERSAALQEKKLPYTTPKISMAIKAAPKTRKKKTA